MLKSVWRSVALLSWVAAASISTAAVAVADDAQIIAGLKQKGAVITETGGAVSAVQVSDCTKFADEDFRAIGKFSRLKSLSFGLGFSGKSLVHFAGLTDLELLATNGMQFSDADLQALATLKSLRSLAFFHPGKEFTGSGLAHLASLTNLKQLSVGGSSSFNDDGLAAIGKLAQLESVRIWHVAQTNAGVKHLAALSSLKNLMLGQRLSYKLPASPDAESIPILAQFKSLESLYLDEARLTGAELQPLQALPQLKKLTLRNIEISDTDLAGLRKELPQVDIQWTAPADAGKKRIEALFGAQ